MKEHFKNQIDKGATDRFYYGLEFDNPHEIRMFQHKGTIDTFPELEYVRHLTPDWPLFKDKQ
jgi:hypothetical protein